MKRGVPASGDLRPPCRALSVNAGEVEQGPLLRGHFIGIYIISREFFGP